MTCAYQQVTNNDVHATCMQSIDGLAEQSRTLSSNFEHLTRIVGENDTLCVNTLAPTHHHVSNYLHTTPICSTPCYTTSTFTPARQDGAFGDEGTWVGDEFGYRGVGHSAFDGGSVGGRDPSPSPCRLVLEELSAGMSAGHPPVSTGQPQHLASLPKEAIDGSVYCAQESIRSEKDCLHTSPPKSILCSGVASCSTAKRGTNEIGSEVEFRGGCMVANERSVYSVRGNIGLGSVGEEPSKQHLSQTKYNGGKEQRELESGWGQEKYVTVEDRELEQQLQQNYQETEEK